MAQPKHLPSKDSYTSLSRLRHDDPEELAAMERICNREVMAAEQRMWPYALQYMDNAALLVGNHLSRFRYSRTLGFTSFTFGQDDSSPHDATIARSADNKILGPTERVISLFGKGRPQPRVGKGSEQPNEKLAALTAEALLEMLFKHPLKLSTQRRRAAALMALCGTAIFETEHGESDQPVEVPKMVKRKAAASELYPDEEEGGEEEVADPSGAMDVLMRPEIQMRVWSPLHVGPDPGATNDDDMIWIRRSTFECIDDLWEQYDGSKADGFYPEHLQAMSPSKGTESPLFYWSRVNDLIDSPQMDLAPFSTRWDGPGMAPNHTGKHIFDVKPSRMFPRGRTLVLAGGKIIFCSDQARAWIAPDPRRGYVGRWHEYQMCRWFELVGRWLGVAMVSLIAPLQRKINSIDGIVQENRESIAIAQWLLPQICQVPEGLMSGAPRQHVTYRDVPGHNKPERVPNQALPQELLEERGQLERSINYIASTALMDPNVAPSAARANSIFEFFQRQQLEAKEPAVQVFEDALEGSAQNILLDLQQAGNAGDPWTLERLRMVAPGNSQVAVESFLGTSLLDHHGVKLSVASAILREPEARQARAENAAPFLAPILGQSGRIDELIEALGLGDIVQSPTSKAKERAEWLLAWILEGNLEAVFLMPEIDNFQVIASVFWEFTQTPRFMELEEEQVQKVLEVFDQCQAEIQRQMAAQQAALQQQAAAQEAASGGEK